jgi:hypothetical protein
MNSHCAHNNLSVASPPASTRVCVVFGSEEKEQIPDGFRMGVQVVDGANHRGGAAAGQPFSTFMQRIDQRFAALDEMIAANGEKIAATGEMIAGLIRTQQDAFRTQQDAFHAQQDAIRAQQQDAIRAQQVTYEDLYSRLDESAELYSE